MKTQTYLTSRMNDLPTNCIFDKGKVGCGGTTLAINSSKPYVITVPFINLCDNKTKQSENLFWFKSDTLKRDLVAYLESVEIPKIICVYDAIEKLTKWINPQDYSILIDELHILCKDYSFRNTAAKRVLKNYTLYKEFTFMTATVVEKEFLLEELSEIPVIDITWEDVKEVTVNSIRCIRDINLVTIELVNSFLNGINTGNAYFFVNSVDFIKDIVKVCNLDETNCRVIYSKHNKTDVGIPNGDTLSEPKKINFLTSTVFEGCDLYDEEGRIIIISDNKKKHTLLDISTTVQQIAGRIRNTKYWNEITHLYTTSRYVDITYEEFKEISLKQIEETKAIVSEYNNLSEKARKNIKSLNNIYTNREDDIFYFDANMVKLDILNFKLSHSIYKCRVNVKEEYNKYGFKVSDYNYTPQIIIERADVDKSNFWDILEEVEKEQTGLYVITPVSDRAFEKYSWLKTAIEKLGFERMKEIHNITRIKELIIVTNEVFSNEKKIFNLLRLKLNTGDFISAKNAKELFGDIYNSLGINKTPKGSDLNSYYEIKKTVKSVNGKSTKGYIIIKSNIIYK